MLVLVGKTCSGKNTIKDILINEYGMESVITHTTRPPRYGEENYVDYIFIPETHFKILDKEGWFAETAKYTVASGDTWYYGSAVHDYENSENKVIILNPSGLHQIKKQKIPVVAIYLSVSDKEIRRRARIRGDKSDEIERRIRADNWDFRNINELVDGSFVNTGKPELVAKEIYKCYTKLI